MDADDRVHVLFARSLAASWPWLSAHAGDPGGLRRTGADGPWDPIWPAWTHVDDGLIDVKEQVGTRKVYAITDRGKQALQEEYERLCRMVQDIQPFLGKGGKLP